MATKDLQPASPEEKQSVSSSKKRKSALAEIEVDLSRPEPPSKKARRLLKKGKALPAKPASSDDEGDAGEAKTDGAKGDNKKKKQRSPHGVWIGNLRFTVTKAELRKWLVDNSGGAITDDAITRVHMPTTKKPAAGAAPDKKAAAAAAVENRGFAYVDFASFEANVAAIALSETEMNGRKLLIKDSKSFEGRPKKEEAEASADRGGGGGGGVDAKASKNGPETKTNGGGKRTAGSSTKIFVGNLSFNTTEDDLLAHFEKCGKIRWVKVATFEDSGKCKGYGWVNFEEPDAAQWAVKGFVKVRETVETLEDFMDVDGEQEQQEQQPPAGDDDDEPTATKKSGSGSGSGESDSEEEDEEADENTKRKKKQQGVAKAAAAPARTRTRKWWVNQLLGRNLKIELAEDDQTRYHKRFGKGAAKQKNKQNHQSQEGLKKEDKSQDEHPQDAATTIKKEGVKKEIKYHNDVSVARLTGAAVAPQGKKTTFD